MQRTVSEPVLTTLGSRLAKDEPPSIRPTTPPVPIGPCQICERQLPKLTCHDCIRERLYPLRYESVSVVLQRDSLNKDIETVTAQDTKYSSYEEARLEKQELENTVLEINNRVSELRAELEEHRQYLANLRTGNAKRQALFRETRNVMLQNRESTLEKSRKDIRGTTGKWTQLYERSSDARVLLCREVAGLYLLRQRKRKKVLEYLLNGTVIPDIRQIYSLNPNSITVALSHLAQITVLIASYLGLKLPCEITLPSRDAPAATIRHARFRGFRPLTASLPLLQLHSTDSEQYAMLIEGISMLVYNVGWLCWCQGLEEAAVEIEDIWQPGRNLYRLLLCTPTKHHPALVQWNDVTSEALGQTQGASPPALRRNPNMFLGRVNHSSAHSFLNSPQGLAHMSRWKITLSIVIDRTKHLLVSETSNAEWDMIENEIDEDPAAKFISELGNFGDEDKRSAPNSPQPARAIPISIKKGTNPGCGSPGTTGSPASGSVGKRSAINGGTDVSSGWTKLNPR